MKYLLFTLLTLVNFYLFAQSSTKENIIGVWTIQKISIDTAVTFDIDNPKISYDNAIKNLKKKKPGYSSDDSIEVITKIQPNLNLIGKLFIAFYEDNTYINSKVDSNQIDLSKTEEGTYKIRKKGKKILLKDNGSKNRMRVFLEKNYLILESGKSKQQKKIILKYKKKN